MSLDAYAYCPSEEPILRDELIRAAAERGWTLRPTQGHEHSGDFGVVSGGELADDEYWFGWPTADPRAADYDLALAVRQFDQLEFWAVSDAGSAFGRTSLGIQPYQFDYTPEEAAELEEELGAGYVAALRKAKLLYSTQCNSTESLYVLLVRLIQSLRGGIWEEPQEGVWGSDPAEGWEEWEYTFEPETEPAPEPEAAPCPYCGGPLRTPLAKQCRHCRRDWHDPNQLKYLEGGPIVP
jgi:hypothetical protein